MINVTGFNFIDACASIVDSSPFDLVEFGNFENGWERTKNNNNNNNKIRKTQRRNTHIQSAQSRNGVEEKFEPKMCWTYVTLWLKFCYFFSFHFISKCTRARCYDYIKWLVSLMRLHFKSTKVKWRFKWWPLCAKKNTPWDFTSLSPSPSVYVSMLLV